jgi:hypothetical protein
MRNCDLIYFLEIMPNARWRDFAFWCRFLREKMDSHKGYPYGHHDKPKSCNPRHGQPQGIAPTGGEV